MSTATRERTPERRHPHDSSYYRDGGSQKTGGVAALYIALALLAAIPYFLLIVDYPGASTAADKVGLIVDHYPSLYAMYLASYVVFGLALGLVALAVWDRLRTAAPSTARAATWVGLVWAGTLVASGLVFTYGLTTIEALAAADEAQAAATWQAVEPVALALGGAGGELLGGLFVLLVGVAVLQGGGLPRVLAWLGAAIGIVGLVSVVPALRDLGIAFGLLQIVWFAWLGVVLLRSEASPARAPQQAAS